MSWINLPNGIKLGGNIWQNADPNVFLTLYGSEEAAVAAWSMNAAMASHPRKAALASHRMIAVRGRWCDDPRPYGHVVDVLGAAQELFEEAGWQIASSVEGHPDTGTTIDDLRVVDAFPAEPNARGYNAAYAFKFECEKPDEGFEYSDGDIAALTALAQQVLRHHRTDRYDIAHCEVIYRPEMVTPAQLLAAKQIEEDVEAAENAFGLDDQLGKLLDHRAVAIEDAMTGLPEALQPGDGWTLEVLASKNGLRLATDARSWVNHAGTFDEACEGREAQVVYELPAADGVLQVLAYDKWGSWNLNLWWREAEEISPETASASEASIEASLADLVTHLNGQQG